MLAIFAVSCDSMLDVTPKDELYADIFFQNEEELQLFSNTFYTALIPTASEIYSESSDVILISVPIDEVTGQRTVPTDGGGWSFTALRDINYLLENSDNCDDEDVRNEYDALARFFRAYFYFDMVKLFGDVPWYDKVLESNDPDLYKARDSREYVMEKIVEDLDFAIEYLPEEQNSYRVTKWTALALKSRAMLFEGTFRKYHSMGDFDQYLELCVEASEEFMNNSGYTLYTTGTDAYQSLFNSSTSTRTEEVILARDYSSTLNLFHNVQNYENSITTGAPGLSKRIVNFYLNADGSRFTDDSSYATKGFVEETAGRDPRLAQTIRTPGYTFGGSQVAPSLAYSVSGYHLIKYTIDDSTNGNYNSSVNDMPIFRTAEVYLNLAEAKAELGTITQADLDASINKLRARAGITTDLNLNSTLLAGACPYLSSYFLSEDAGNAYNAIILEIRRERTVELIMEGLRYWDIMRWREGKIFEEDMLGIYFPSVGNYDLNSDGTNDLCIWSGSKPNSATGLLLLELDNEIILTEGTSGNVLLHSNLTRTWNEERDYLYPIPSNQRVLSGGALTQNPGWDDGLTF